MRIAIEIDTDETELSAVIRALKELKKGQKAPPEPEPTSGVAQVELAYQDTARTTLPIGFVPDPEFI